MDKHSNTKSPANSGTPAIKKGLMELACMLARYAAREFTVSSPVPSLPEESADD